MLPLIETWFKEYSEAVYPELKGLRAEETRVRYLRARLSERPLFYVKWWLECYGSCLNADFIWGTEELEPFSLVAVHRENDRECFEARFLIVAAVVLPTFVGRGEGWVAKNRWFF